MTNEPLQQAEVYTGFRRAHSHTPARRVPNSAQAFSVDSAQDQHRFTQAAAQRVSLPTYQGAYRLCKDVHCRLPMKARCGILLLCCVHALLQTLQLGERA